MCAYFFIGTAEDNVKCELIFLLQFDNMKVGSENFGFFVTFYCSFYLCVSLPFCLCVSFWSDFCKRSQSIFIDFIYQSCVSVHTVTKLTKATETAESNVLVLHFYKRERERDRENLKNMVKRIGICNLYDQFDSHRFALNRHTRWLKNKSWKYVGTHTLLRSKRTTVAM